MRVTNGTGSADNWCMNGLSEASAGNDLLQHEAPRATEMDTTESGGARTGWEGVKTASEGVRTGEEDVLAGESQAAEHLVGENGVIVAEAQAAALAAIAAIHRDAVALIGAIAEPWLRFARGHAQAAPDTEQIGVLHHRPAVPGRDAAAA